MASRLPKGSPVAPAPPRDHVDCPPLPSPGGGGEGASSTAGGTLLCWLVKCFGFRSWAMGFGSNALESCIDGLTAVEAVSDRCFRTAGSLTAVG